jgi:hypothetical protein
MARGQVTKYLREDEDGVYIAIHPYGETVSVSDKLYASPTVAAKMKGGHIIKISKALLIQLDKEQNGERNDSTQR